MSKLLKAAIVGCGGIANQKHMPSLSRNANVEIVSFCDLVEERAVKAAKDYGTADAKIFTDYRKVLEDKAIDIVYVLTPNREHSEITIAALEAGKHVMCEKPMAKTSKEALAMLEAAKKSGKKLTIGYQNRYTDQSIYLKKMCDDGELGDIYFAKAHAIRRRAVPTWGVFMDKDAQGGGPLIDIGTHALDMTLWFMNNYKPKMVMGSVFYKLGKSKLQANAFGPWDTDTYEVEDSAFGLIKMENGATIFLESSWALNTLDVKEGCSSLCGTLGGADMTGGLKFNYVKNERQISEYPDFSMGGVAFFDGDQGGSESDKECNGFINSIIKDIDVIVKPEQAYVVTQILEAIYESDKTGAPVYL